MPSSPRNRYFYPSMLPLSVDSNPHLQEISPGEYVGLGVTMTTVESTQTILYDAADQVSV